MTTLTTIAAGVGAITDINDNFIAASPAALYGRRAAATSGLTWGYYGLKAWTYLFGRSRTSEIVYKSLYTLLAVAGSLLTLQTLIDLADAVLFMLAVINIIGLYVVLLLLEEGGDRADADAVAMATGGEIVGQVPRMRVYEIGLPTQTLEGLDAAIAVARTQAGARAAKISCTTRRLSTNRRRSRPLSHRRPRSRR